MGEEHRGSPHIEDRPLTIKSAWYLAGILLTLGGFLLKVFMWVDDISDTLALHQVTDARDKKEINARLDSVNQSIGKVLGEIEDHDSILEDFERKLNGLRRTQAP